jgi:tetratricopeptide (TPR) repeat protein
MSARTLKASRLGLAVALVAELARGQGAASAPSSGGRGVETPPEVAARAREHFQRGRELYQAGSYREAIAELEAAQALDPHAKDLVYNLAIVNEKLGQIDAALGYVHAYVDMDLEPQERARADAYQKRLEGAKKEADARAAAAALAAPPSPAAAQAPATPVAAAEHGRVDTATIAAAAVAVGGLTFGTIFGITALAAEPKSFVSGKDGKTYADYLGDQQHAHTDAIVADVGFGVGVAAAAIASYLYLGRTKENTPSPPPPEPTVSAAPATDGGHGAVLFISGRF